MVTPNERRALYPGSFDPVTNGHKYVMDRMAAEFDRGIVAVGHNPAKRGRFPVYDRLEMLREVAGEHPNLAVTSFVGLFQADMAEMVGAQTIVRGMRGDDYNAENDIRQTNRTVNPKVETVFMIPPNELMQVSSSMVMGLVGFEGWEEQVAKMVPVIVFDRIQSRQERIDKEDLEVRWNRLYERIGAKEGNAKKVFEDLYRRYSEPHRKYHTLQHITSSLNELELVRDIADDPDVIELGIWFHDAVHNGSKPHDFVKEKADDEGDSAQLSLEILTNEMGLSPEFAEKVGSLVMITKYNKLPGNIDEALMGDIDLAIFGRAERLFDTYERKVRDEYHWVPELEFREKRAEILAGFLPPHRAVIYQSQFFRDRYEELAQKNVRRSVARLRS